MMKHTFVWTKVLVAILIVIATITLDSCVREKLVLSYRDRAAISFNTNIGTKARETKLAQLDSFNVYSYIGSSDYFDDIFYRKTGSNPVEFNSRTPHYWPSSGTVNFEVFSPVNLNYNKDDHQILFETAAQIHNQVDFIAGETSGTKVGNEFEGVSLGMLHKLSQIRLYVRSTYPGRKIEIKKFALNNIKGSGKYSFGDDKWEDVDVLSSYEVTLSPVCTLDASVSTDTVAFLTPWSATIGSAMFIPQELGKWDQQNDSLNTNKKPFLSMLIKVTDNDTPTYPTKSCNTEFAWCAIPFEVELLEGHAYTFTVTFDEGLGFVHPDGALLDGNSMGPFDPGERIIDSSIPVQFNVSHIEWDANDEEYIFIYELEFEITLDPWNEENDRGEWNNGNLFPNNPDLENWYNENEDIWKIVYPDE